jgi:hypothetical protein
VATFLVYGAGMSALLLLITLALAFGKQAVVARLRLGSAAVGRFASGNLVLAGGYIVFFWASTLSGDGLDQPAAIHWVEQLSARAVDACRRPRPPDATVAAISGLTAAGGAGQGALTLLVERDRTGGEVPLDRLCPLVGVADRRCPGAFAADGEIPRGPRGAPAVAGLEGRPGRRAARPREVRAVGSSVPADDQGGCVSCSVCVVNETREDRFREQVLSELEVLGARGALPGRAPVDAFAHGGGGSGPGCAASRPPGLRPFRGGAADVIGSRSGRS